MKLLFPHLSVEEKEREGGGGGKRELFLILNGLLEMQVCGYV